MNQSNEYLNHRLYEKAREPFLRLVDAVRRKARRRRSAKQRVAIGRLCEEGRPGVFPAGTLRDGLRPRARIGTDEGVAGRLQETAV